MKIKVEKWIIDGEVSYKVLNIERCCDKLINSKNTRLNKAYDEHGCYDYDSEEDYSVKLFRKEEWTDWEDTFSENYYEKIDYCPFCGEKIIVEIVNEIDKTGEYKELQKQRSELWKKCCKTDSKKKEETLRQQVNELDIKINNILTSDDFIKEND